MPALAAKRPSGEGSLPAIQALMCELGADPPGYFDPFPRQPLRWAIVDPELSPMLRCLEWVRFHTVCYDGVPKNAQGDPQRSPYCLGLDGERLNRLDCARETGLSTSVVNRQFAALQRLGYIQVKKDGSIWYRGKVEPHAEAAVRQSVAECLQGPRTRSAEPARPTLQQLVTERVITASLLKATQLFPAEDQDAVEAHILEVARWERQEIARQIALVRQEAERRYQAAAWNGYHLEKSGRSWERASAQESPVEKQPQSLTTSPTDRACVPEEAFASSSQISLPENHSPVRAEKLRVAAEASCSSGSDSVVSVNRVASEERRETKPGTAASTDSLYSGHRATVHQGGPEPTPAHAERAYGQHIRQAFAGTGKGIPTDGQLGAALAHLPPQATPQGFARFIHDKLPGIRHAGAVVRLAQEYAHELHYAPRGTVFRCGQCHDEGFVLPGGQYCACLVGLRRRKTDEREAEGKGP